MTSNYHSSHCEKDVRYPSTDRVAVGEDYVDFIYQFGKDSKISKKDCKNTTSKSNIRNNIIGTPSNFPSHEDFLLYLHGRIKCHTYVPEYRKDYYFHHIIDLEFHEAVYPIRISIYEVYNFGNVFEVWAQDSEDESRWILLWNGRPKFHKISQLLKHTGSRNFCELFDPFNTTRDYENAYLDILDLQKEFPKYCVIYKSDVATSFHKSKLMHKQVSREEDVLSSKQEYVNHPLLRIHWNHVKFIKDIKFSSGKSKEQLDSFSALSVKYSKNISFLVIILKLYILFLQDE
ncbi:uncharacterized protein [Temnothorax longispinosus]|uniref:uncharacterized protein isoform X1 n=1 Tax=Temnothorax longispinosus TaxID=300112 RepID=UPI003A9964F7